MRGCAACPPATAPLVVLPSYNGARKLPVLTPLLALLLAREGLPVLVHGTRHRIDAACWPSNVLAALGRAAADRRPPPSPTARSAFAPTELLHPGLKRLLDVRRVVGLRNPGHSVVKLMQPSAGPCVVVGSYTHPEYARIDGRDLRAHWA